MPLYPPQSSASATLSVATKTANYTLTDADDVILADATGGVFDITLHNPATAMKKIYRIEKTDTSVNKVNIAGYNLNGASRKMCTPTEVLELYPDGSTWQVISHKTAYYTTFTPTGSWTTNTPTYTGNWHRVDGYMFASMHIALTGAPQAATILVFNTPSANPIDTARLLTTNTLSSYVGSGMGISATNGFFSYASYNTTTSVNVYCQNGPSASNHAASGVTSTQPFTFANGDFVNVTIKVPVTDWW